MSELFASASKLNKKRMSALYEQEKNDVYFLCSMLLPQSCDPSEITANVFRHLWEELPGWDISSDAEGTKRLKLLAFSLCADKLKRADKQIFKHPGSVPAWQNRGISLPDYSPVERFMAIGFACTEEKPAVLAKILGITEFQAQSALSSADKKAKEEIRIQLSMAQAKTTVPEQLDKKVQEVISAVKVPKKPVSKKLLLAGWAVIVVIAVIISSVIVLNHKSSLAYDYIAEINVEDYGTITVALDSDAAPITVQNFVDLANSGFYDGLTFHRIIEGFMIQGGDPLGNGTGGSDETIKGEFSANGVDNTLSHTRGAISMARSSDYDSASSQFFIVQEDSTFLDGQYACFGYVTDGMDIVDAICEDANPTDDNGTISADDQPVITSVTIRAFDAE